MARKKQPKQEVEFSCYLCLTFPSLKILRREGNDNEIAKECNGNIIIGKHLACSNFVPTTFFFCDHHNHRISIDTCNRRRTQAYSECPKYCALGSMARKIGDKGKLIKRVEIEDENGSLFSPGDESEPWRIDLEPNPGRSPHNQKGKKCKEDLGHIIDRIFS